MKKILLWSVLLGFVLVGLNVNKAVAADGERDIAGYDDGFYIKSKDDKIKMTINGSSGIEYLFESIEGTDDSTNTFHLYDASLSFGVEYDKRFGLNLHALGGGTDSSFAWRTNAYYKIFPDLKVTFGQIGLPFAQRSGLLTKSPVTSGGISGEKELFIERRGFSLGGDVGGRLDGKLNRLKYAVSISNGSGAYSKNVNNEFTYSGRASYRVLENKDKQMSWDVGVGTGFEDEDKVSKTGFPLLWEWLATVDSQFKYRRLNLKGAYFMRKTRAIQPTSLAHFTLDDVGYYVQSAFKLIPGKLDLQGELSSVHREGADNNSLGFGGGVKWYLQEFLTLKADYTNVLDYEGISGPDNETIHRIAIQLGLSF